MISFSQNVVNTLPDSRPDIRKKTFISCKLIVLAHSPENSCALILLLAPGWAWRLLDVIPLIPPTIRFLHFLAPAVEALGVFGVAATVQRIRNIGTISRPDVSIVRVQCRTRDYSPKVLGYECSDREK